MNKYLRLHYNNFRVVNKHVKCIKLRLFTHYTFSSLIGQNFVKILDSFVKILDYFVKIYPFSGQKIALVVKDFGADFCASPLAIRTFSTADPLLFPQNVFLNHE